MNDKEIEVLCKGGCGQTFSAFLAEMKEQNAKVVCPKCGKTHDYVRSGETGKDHPPKRP